MNRKPFAIFIGEDDIFQALKGLLDKEKWNWHDSVETPSKFIEGLESEEISSDIEAIFITDVFIDSKNEEEVEAFKEVLKENSPYCYIGVLNFYEELSIIIDDFITNVEDEDTFSALDSNCKIIEATSPNVKEIIEDSINEFISNEFPDSIETIKIIQGEYTDSGSDPSLDRDTLKYIDKEEKEALEDEVESQDNKRVYENETTIYRKYTQSDFDGLPRGKLITVSSSKGGVGKSTVTLATAAKMQRISEELVSENLIEKPWKIVVLDMDILDSQIGYFTKTKGATIGQIFSKGINREAIESTVHYNEGLKIDLILGSRRPENGRYYPDDFYAKLIDSLRALYDFVILDTSVDYTSHLIGEICYKSSDRILLITEPVVPSTLSLSKCVEYVVRDEERGGLQIPAEKIGIVVNRFQSPQDLGEKRTNNIGIQAIEKISKGIPIVSVIPFKPLAITGATNNGKVEKLLDTAGVQVAIEYCAYFAIYGKDEDE